MFLVIIIILHSSLTTLQKLSIIYCPNHQGLSTQQKKRGIIRAALDASGMDYDFVQSESADSVERLVRMMIDNGYKTIVICGGDSALNDAVNVLMQYEKKIRKTIQLGIIPNGISNDFATFWGLTTKDINTAIQTIKKGRERLVDVGCIRYSNRKGEASHRYFLNCVNVGLVASYQQVRRQTRHIFGLKTLSFLSSFFVMLTKRIDYKIHLVMNGEDIRQHGMAVCVGNCRGYGQTPNAVPYNGLLDVSLISNNHIMQFFSGVHMFLSRRFLMHRGVQSYRTREINCLSAPHAKVCVDGRILDTSRPAYSFYVSHEEIRFLIP